MILDQFLNCNLDLGSYINLVLLEVSWSINLDPEEEKGNVLKIMLVLPIPLVRADITNGFHHSLRETLYPEL